MILCVFMPGTCARVTYARVQPPHPSASMRGVSPADGPRARATGRTRAVCLPPTGHFGGKPSRPLVLPREGISDARLDTDAPVTLSTEATRQVSQHKSMFLFIL